MSNEKLEAMARRATADIILDRAAQELRAVLNQQIAALDPFPAFPGSYFTYAIEIEGGIAENKDRGCVVVCPDGEFYEFIVGMDFSSPFPDPLSMRKEETKKLELPTQEYIVYAYNAIARVTELLLEQIEGKQG